MASDCAPLNNKRFDALTGRRLQIGSGPRKEAGDYTIKVLPPNKTLASRRGWTAFLSLNGVLVHQSEHSDRNGALFAAYDALRRAVRLRE